ncbi:MAG: chorismate synthase [Candidatus Paceibacteria bacterium]|jgi:chorismate synthase
MSRLTWRTGGESHGPSLVGLVEGMPAGLEFSIERVNHELARRQLGYGRGGRMKIETDKVDILSGLKKGITLGSPIAFLVKNKDHVIDDLPIPGDPRPGHADLAGCQKYGHRDPRAILERASARETASRVAAGGIARQLLENLGVEVFAHSVEVGGICVKEGAFAAAGEKRAEIRESSDFLSLDPTVDGDMRAAVDAAKADGDTVGGVVEILVLNLPPGLGGYASSDERLTGRWAGALMSIPAMKGVEIGLGFEASRRRGSAVHDAIELAASPNDRGWGRFRRRTNNAGGLEGGMTNGEHLCLRLAMKPIPTLRQGLDSVDFESGETVHATWQRSDITALPAAGVVGEAMVALVLADAVLAKFGGDSMVQLRRAWELYREDLSGI